MTYYSVLLFVHLSLFLYILLSKKFTGFRMPLLGIYILNIFLIWLWVRKRYPLSTVAQDTIVIIGIPIILLILIYWLASVARRREKS